MDGGQTLATFVFTDIVGSTRLWQRHPDDMPVALERHDQIIREAVASEGGFCFAGGGDGFGAVFEAPRAAAAATAKAQAGLSNLEVGGDRLAVRMGIHTGEAQERGGDFFGLTVNRAARIASAANGGQILASAATGALLDGDMPLVPLGTYRLADLFEPVELVQIGAGSFPPVRALDPDKHNLPVRFTSLIGREALVDRVTTELADGRLVTLVGPGGIGKTTVALEVAANLVPETDRGVWFAPLDEVAPDAPIDSAVAAALGMAPIEGWRRTAAGRDQLVVLDNAEHVIGQTAGTAASLLRAGPAIRLLVTSREPLGVPGESVIDVPPLDDHDTVDLFVDRANVDSADTDLVAGLAARLDGLPLVAELVAAHATRLPLTDLFASLDTHGVGALTSRGTSPRHQSATEAIAWSYDLLEPAEQAAFERLAVFDGTFTIRNAADLADASTATIHGLVEKSLIQRSGDRYRLLEPIKEYATARLAARGGLQPARRRLVELVADASFEIDAQHGPRNYEAWATEFDWAPGDLVAAFEWVGTADLELAARLIRSIPGGLATTAPDWQAEIPIVDALTPIADRWSTSPGRWRWELLRCAFAESMVWRESDAQARTAALRSLPEAQEDPEFMAACAFVRLTATAAQPLPLDETEALADEIITLDSRYGWWEPGIAHGILGSRYLRHGRHDEARQKLLQALDDPTLKPQARWLTLSDLAETEVFSGHPERALERLDAIDTDDVDVLREVTNEKAHAYVALGELDVAWQHLEPLIAHDLAQTQPTTISFCAAADYFRAKGEHRTATWFMAKMLEGRGPSHRTHERVIEEARTHLGDAIFEVEFDRGAAMDIYSLYGLLTEGP